MFQNLYNFIPTLGNGSSENKPPASTAGLFSFGSSNAKTAFGSFGGSTNTEEKATFSFTKGMRTANYTHHLKNLHIPSYGLLNKYP